MGFKKIRIGEEEIFEIKILDIDGQRIGEWKCMKTDFPKVVKILNKKYGMKMFIKVKENGRDLDWAY